MLFNKIRLFVLIFCYVLICSIFILNVTGLILPLELAGASEGKPKVLIRKTDLIFSDIRQIISDDDSIYLLFGQYGVVQAYSYDGRYKYSISVYDHLNGRTEIASDGELLYISDKVGNIYSFSDGIFFEFFNQQESKGLKKQLQFGVSDRNWVLKHGSVWHISGDGIEKCVVPRPVWLTVYQNDALTMVLFPLVIISVMISRIPTILKQR
jgi:hypothetical protein